MVVKRYVGSFVFSSVTYAGIFVLFLFLFNTNAIVAEKSQKAIETIKIALIEPMPPIEKKIVPPPPLPEPIVKQEPKKIIKKAPIKKIVKKKIEPKPIEKVVKKVEPQPIVEPIVKQEVVVPTKPIAPVVPKVDINQIKNSFLTKLRKTINSNKFYPKAAQRRGIEGNVKVTFRILNNGCVEAIQIVSGKSVFSKAVTEAIQKSFPLKVPKELSDFPMVVNLQLNFSLS